MYSRLLLCLALLGACAPITATTTVESTVTETASSVLPADLDTVMPTDPDVRMGQLDNGLRYFIEENNYPENRAALRLVLDAGSVLEDDDQLGIAHFMEHMAFNGTERFPANELVTYLESVGTQFGAHLNAHTSFDETVYKLLVPTDDAEQFDKALVVLREWAGGVTLDPAEVDKERGVVIEEWRSRNVGMQGRMSEAVVPVMFYGAPHAERLPIGTEESLQSFTQEAVERFYHDWYRPNLMAVAVVGPVDVDATEARIQELFGDLENPADARERKRYPLPNHEEDLVQVIADPEMPSTAVTVMAKHDAREEHTYAQYRQALMLDVGTMVLNERLGDAAQQADRKFLGAFGGTQPLIPGEEADVLTAATVNGGALEGLQAVLLEAERLKRFGVQQAEFDRAIAKLMAAQEAAYEERETTHSRAHVEELVRYFLHDEFMPGVEQETAITKALLQTLTPAEVSGMVQQRFMPKTGLVVNVVVPQREGLESPTEEDVREVLARVASLDVVPPTDEEPTGPLMAATPEPGSITARRALPDTLGAEEWTLSNGIKVWVKPTDFQAAQVLFEGYSLGGDALVDDDHWESGEAAPSLRAYSGLGAHTAPQLQKLLAGKRLSVSASIGNSSERLSGRASPDDLETALQLVHLMVTEPRFTQDGMALYLQERRTALSNKDVSPESRYREALAELEWQGHPRRVAWDLARLDKVDLAKAEVVWNDRFGDGDDFVWSFVGNVDTAELERLVTTYLATLPVREGSEEAGDDGARRPDGKVEKTLRIGNDPKAEVRVRFHGPMEDVSLEDEHLLASMGEVMRVRLREVIREELGGTYGVSASATAYMLPRASYVAGVTFQCDNERAEELAAAMHATLESLRTEPLDEAYVSQVQEKQRRAWEDRQRRNGAWQGMIRDVAVFGRDAEALVHPEPRIDALTAEQLQQGFATYLDPERMLQVIWLPEEE